MVVFTGSWLLDILFILSPLLVLLCRLYTKNFNYWKNRNVPYRKPHCFFGNIREPLLGKISWRDFVINLYRHFKENDFGGYFLFRNPVIMICDPVLVEKVMVQDFAHFHDRASWWNLEEVLTKSLYDTRGEKWRTMRYNMSPMFTTGKLKGMFDQIFNCGSYLLKQVEEHIESEKPVEAEPLLYHFTIEVIASCAFGVQLFSDLYGTKMFQKAAGSFRMSPLYMTKIILAIVNPRMVSLLRIKLIPKQVIEFILNLTKSTIKYRQVNRIERTDILQLMLTLKEREENNVMNSSSAKAEKSQGINQPQQTFLRENFHSQEKLFTEDFIASHMFNFLFNGVQPSVVTLSFALFEVARLISVQKELQVEIDSAIAKHGGWTYAAFKEMSYLDQVLQETMRLYTNNDVLVRVVTKPYSLPGTELILEEGMVVYIPVCAIHMDPQYYPEPNSFNPGRFSGNNFKQSALFLPFGHGPRICIALKFTVLMMKVCLARILSKYTVTISRKMQLPLKIDAKSFSPKVEGGLWLEFKERERCQI